MDFSLTQKFTYWLVTLRYTYSEAIQSQKQELFWADVFHTRRHQQLKENFNRKSKPIENDYMTT